MLESEDVSDAQAVPTGDGAVLSEVFELQLGASRHARGTMN